MTVSPLIQSCTFRRVLLERENVLSPGEWGVKHVGTLPATYQRRSYRCLLCHGMKKKWPQIRYARKFGYGAGFVAADSEAINSLQSSETYQCSQ